MRMRCKRRQLRAQRTCMATAHYTISVVRLTDFGYEITKRGYFCTRCFLIGSNLNSKLIEPHLPAKTAHGDFFLNFT